MSEKKLYFFAVHVTFLENILEEKYFSVCCKQFCAIELLVVNIREYYRTTNIKTMYDTEWKGWFHLENKKACFTYKKNPYDLAVKNLALISWQPFKWFLIV